MQIDQVLSHLKKHGQLLDLEIASATGIALAEVRKSLADLTTRGEISQCSVTHFNGDKLSRGSSAGFRVMCRPSRLVARPGPPKASRRTRNRARFAFIGQAKPCKRFSPTTHSTASRLNSC